MKFYNCLFLFLGFLFLYLGENNILGLATSKGRAVALVFLMIVFLNIIVSIFLKKKSDAYDFPRGKDE